MAWLSRVNFISSDTLSFTDVNNLGNDIRAWGGNVNGGGYTLSNVVLSASAGTIATVIGGTGTTSSLTLRSTSGVGTTGADIIFQAGNNGASEVMRLQNGGNVGIGTASPGAKLTVSAGDAASATNQFVISGGRNLGSAIGSSGSILFTNSYWNSGFGSAMVSAIDSGSAGGHLALATLADGGGTSGTPTERMRIDSSGNVGIGTSSPSFPLSFGTSIGNKIGLYDGGSGSGYGFGIQGNILQIFCPLTVDRVGIGHGNSSSFTETLTVVDSRVGIGVSAPATSARLEIAGTTGALLVPRLTTTERNALTAVNGMIIYNTTDNQMQGRINGAWVAM